jgi:hypothetical protein
MDRVERDVSSISVAIWTYLLWKGENLYRKRLEQHDELAIRRAMELSQIQAEHCQQKQD